MAADLKFLMLKLVYTVSLCSNVSGLEFATRTVVRLIFSTRENVAERVVKK